MESPTHKTIRYLQDLHAAEKVTEDILDKLADDAEAASEVRVSAAECARECQHRQESISARIKVLGSERSALKDFANSAMGIVSDIFNSGHDRTDLITMDTIKAHSAIHLVHGSYCALEAFCEMLGDRETAGLANLYRKETELAAARLVPAIEASARRVLLSISR